MLIPESVATIARDHPEAAAWVERLPHLIHTYTERWDLRHIEAPLPTCRRFAWVGAAEQPDGREVVLKLALPHAEASTEWAGLQSFAGRGAVHLLANDATDFALLVERCRPGTDIRALPTPADADAVAVQVLTRLWRAPDERAAPIGSLADTVDAWNREYATTRAAYPPDLVDEAARLGAELVRSTTDADTVVLHGDFNPSNVLAAEREPWLAIDPKPLIGDPAHDLAQYLANWVDEADASGDPVAWFADRVGFFADALHLDAGRIASWTFVKAVGWNWGPRVAGLFRVVGLRFGERAARGWPRGSGGAPTRRAGPPPPASGRATS